MAPRVFITGSAGYIGSALIYKIHELFPKWIICEYDLIDDNDIMDVSKLRECMVEFKPDVVVHLAACSSVTDCNNSPRKAFEVNALGTKNIVKIMKLVGCKNIIYASTSAVYGDYTGIKFEEDDLLNPSSMYAYTKLLGEHVIVSNDEINHVIFRMFNVVGNIGNPEIDNSPKPGHDRLFAALKSGYVKIYGKKYDTKDGTCERDYVSLLDICNAYIMAICVLSSDINLRKVYNLCTGVRTSVLTLIKIWNKTVYDLFDEDKEYRYKLVSYEYTKPRLGDPGIVVGESDKIFNELGWQPLKSIKDIVYDIIYIDKS